MAHLHQRYLVSALFRGAAKEQEPLPFTLSELIRNGRRELDFITNKEIDEEMNYNLSCENEINATFAKRVRAWNNIAWAKGFFSHGEMWGFEIQEE